ncbi:hypothetical protein B0I35DRAFT_417906 [Stachybotrys elegans]|uniref:MOZ protein represents a chromatin-associated acetyltransferase n=1 Tax=Stachybotrys elegans TaxID=80388 RepID=A0A8K0WY83_9HYPO|nr:hypothetical protein B0I35DRAFT_417906 [Stachybotrys elegans]
MTTIGRLTFLYPHLLRATTTRPSPRGAWDIGSTRAWKGTFAPRHGKGVEPRRVQKGSNATQQQPPAQAAEVAGEVEGSVTAATTPTSSESQSESKESEVESPSTPNTIPETPAPAPAEPKEAPPVEGLERARIAREEAKQSGPLEEVLHLGPPEEMVDQQRKGHPPMQPPPYMHHFDTYSLVKQLQQGGYSQGQAVTAMKGIRTLLAQNLDVAQASLVSKSDVENETYLFRAACSELGTEVKNNRRLQEEQMRQQRTHLQHEVDNLTQSLNQELLTLNDNVRGMFNDRRMAVREEQKAGDSAIQQINYKISIMLSSDSKSEIESLRWILIRRSVLGIIFMAVLTLGTLRYASYVSHERVKEAERKKREEEELRRDGGRKDRSSAADAAAILAAN